MSETNAEKLKIAVEALSRIENHFYFDKSKADSKDLDFCIEVAKQARQAILKKEKNEQD